MNQPSDPEMHPTGRGWQQISHQARSADWPLLACLLAGVFGHLSPILLYPPLLIQSLIDPWSSHKCISFSAQGRSTHFSLFSAINMGLTSPCTAAHAQLQTPQGRHIISNCEQMLLVFINLQTLYLPISPTFLSHSLFLLRGRWVHQFSSHLWQLN